MPRLSRKKRMKETKHRNMSKKRVSKKRVSKKRVSKKLVSKKRVNRKKRSNRKSRKKRNTLFGGALKQEEIKPTLRHIVTTSDKDAFNEKLKTVFNNEHDYHKILTEPSGESFLDEVIQDYYEIEDPENSDKYLQFFKAIALKLIDKYCEGTDSCTRVASSLSELFSRYSNSQDKSKKQKDLDKVFGKINQPKKETTRSKNCKEITRKIDFKSHEKTLLKKGSAGKSPEKQ